MQLQVVDANVSVCTYRTNGQDLKLIKIFDFKSILLFSKSICKLSLVRSHAEHATDAHV